MVVVVVTVVVEVAAAVVAAAEQSSQAEHCVQPHRRSQVHSSSPHVLPFSTFLAHQFLHWLPVFAACSSSSFAFVCNKVWESAEQSDLLLSHSPAMPGKQESRSSRPRSTMSYDMVSLFSIERRKGDKVAKPNSGLYSCSHNEVRLNLLKL